MFFANVGGGLGGVEPSERLPRLAERVLWVMVSVTLASLGVKGSQPFVRVLTEKRSFCLITAVSALISSFIIILLPIYGIGVLFRSNTTRNW